MSNSQFIKYNCNTHEWSIEVIIAGFREEYQTTKGNAQGIIKSFENKRKAKEAK